MDASGAKLHSFAPRVTVDYQTLIPVVEAWAKVCTRVAVYEHAADTNVSRTHCHFLMMGCRVKEERLKRMFKEILPALPAKGNEFWKWSSATTPDESFLTYMSKGELRPKYLKNFSDETVEE